MLPPAFRRTPRDTPRRQTSGARPPQALPARRARRRSPASHSNTRPRTHGSLSQCVTNAGAAGKQPIHAAAEQISQVANGKIDARRLPGPRKVPGNGAADPALHVVPTEWPALEGHQHVAARRHPADRLNSAAAGPAGPSQSRATRPSSPAPSAGRELRPSPTPAEPDRTAARPRPARRSIRSRYRRRAVSEPPSGLDRHRSARAGPAHPAYRHRKANIQPRRQPPLDKRADAAVGHEVAAAQRVAPPIQCAEHRRHRSRR